MASDLEDPLCLGLDVELDTCEAAPEVLLEAAKDDPLDIVRTCAPVASSAPTTAVSPTPAGETPSQPSVSPVPLLRHPSDVGVATPTKSEAPTIGKQDGTCVHCGVPMRNLLGTVCDEGPLHNECVPEYRRRNVERCAHCNNALRQARKLVGDKKVHPECVDAFKTGKAYVPPRKCGMFRKFSVGRSRVLGRRNWQDRFGVLCSSVDGLAYFESEADAMAYENGSRARLPNGTVRLGQGSPGCRIISKPTFRHHPKASNASKELILVFSENGKELMLLMQFQSWEERCEWLRVLETYVYAVDDPKDYPDV